MYPIVELFIELHVYELTRTHRESPFSKIVCVMFVGQKSSFCKDYFYKNVNF